MIKKILIVFVIIIFIFSLFRYLSKKDESSKKIELTYKQSAGIPFRWEYEIEDESIVKFEKSYVIKDENKGGNVGAKVYTNYVFKGLKKGTTTITFKFVNFTNNQIVKEEKNIVKVDNNLNISLVGIPVKK